MGKNWKGGKGTGKGQHDFASCRGHGVVIGTCDAARERETSKELVNLLNQAIEEIYPSAEHDTGEDNRDDEIEEESNQPPSSIENLLRAELNEVKQKKHGSTQNAVSIKTDVKGITLIKLNRRKFCPIKLVNAIFERVKRENASCCRHVIRMIPLKHVCFPNEEELRETMQKVVLEGLMEMGLTLPTSNLESVSKRRRMDTTENSSTGDFNATSEPAIPLDGTMTKKFSYLVHFKARNHNVLTKDLTLSVAADLLRPYAYGDVHNPEVCICFVAHSSNLLQ